jgi:hypothetical protein
MFHITNTLPLRLSGSKPVKKDGIYTIHKIKKTSISNLHVT